MTMEPRGVGVLVADGDRLSLERAGEVLSAGGKTAFLAASAAAGLEVVRSGQVDVVVASLKLPVGGGGPFLARVGGVAPDAGRVILATTSEAGVVADLLSSGAAQRFLASPWEAALLIQAVEAVLRPVPPTPGSLMVRKTILVAEDSFSGRRLLAGLLRGRHEILEAEDGVSALALARDRKPDLVIVSTQLRGLSPADLPGLLRGLGTPCPVLVHGDPAALPAPARRLLGEQATGIHSSTGDLIAAVDALLVPPAPPRKTPAPRPRPPRAPRGPARRPRRG